MSSLALTLVVLAAAMHAVWNFFLKKSGGGLGILTLSAIVASIALTPPALYLLAVGSTLSPLAFGFVIGSGVLHLAYFLLLDRAYRSAGDSGHLSVVYPLARATGPLLTILAATLFLGEKMSALSLAGAALIGVAALLLTGNPLKIIQARAGAGFALLCGSAIACYTLWDKQAVAMLLIPPVVLDWGANLTRIAMMIPMTLQREPGAIARAWKQHRTTVLAIGLMSPLSYILVLTAMVFTPVSYVAPARELSILFAAFLGTRLLDEGNMKRRLLAAAAMVLGLIALVRG